MIRLPTAQPPQRTDGPGTSTPPNRRPGPLDGAIRHPQPRDRRPPSFSVGLGPGNGSTCRRPARALDNAIRPPVPRPRLEMSHRSLPRNLFGFPGFRRRSGRSDVPPASAAALGTRAAARPTCRTLGTDKPATPSALPVPSVQPATVNVPTIEPPSNTCSILTASTLACHPRIEAIWWPTHRWCNFIQARRGSPQRNRPGAMAQLVAHHTGSVGVRGSSPLSSTEIAGQDRSKTGPDLIFVSGPRLPPVLVLDPVCRNRRGRVCSCVHRDRTGGFDSNRLDQPP